jgi:hypothetical protein
MGLRHWFSTPKSWLPGPRCPLCGRRIVKELGPVYDGSVFGSVFFMPKSPPYTVRRTYRDARIAACPLHGQQRHRSQAK